MGISDEEFRRAVKRIHDINDTHKIGIPHYSSEDVYWGGARREPYVKFSDTTIVRCVSAADIFPVDAWVNKKYMSYYRNDTPNVLRYIITVDGKSGGLDRWPDVSKYILLPKLLEYGDLRVLLTPEDFTLIKKYRVSEETYLAFKDGVNTIDVVPVRPIIKASYLLVKAMSNHSVHAYYTTKFLTPEITEGGSVSYRIPRELANRMIHDAHTLGTSISDEELETYTHDNEVYYLTRK
jgi:hypothetical protein